MKTMKYSAVVVAAVILAGCASDTTHQPLATKPKTADHSLMASVGVNVDQAQNKVARTGINNITDTGLAVGMTQKFGAGGLAAGVLGVLANGGPGLEGQTLIIAQLPRGAAAQSFEKSLSESLYRTSGLKLEDKGYSRVTDPKFPAAVTFIQHGCTLTRQGYYAKNCSQRFYASLQPAQSATQAGTSHRVSILYGGREANLKAVGRQLADMHPKEVSLYLPPERVAGATSRPRIYRAGQETTLD